MFKSVIMKSRWPGAIAESSLPAAEEIDPGRPDCRLQAKMPATSLMGGLKTPPVTSRKIRHPGIRRFRVLFPANRKPTPKGRSVPELKMRVLKLQIQ